MHLINTERWGKALPGFLLTSLLLILAGCNSDSGSTSAAVDDSDNDPQEETEDVSSGGDAGSGESQGTDSGSDGDSDSDTTTNGRSGSVNLPEALARAHWIDTDTLIWHAFDTSGVDTVRLYHSQNAELDIADGSVHDASGHQTLHETGNGVIQCDPADDNCKFGYLDGPAYTFAQHPGDSTLRDILKQQLMMVAYDSNGTVMHYDRVQIPGVLDDLYAEGSGSAYEADLGLVFDGATVHFNLWAPTAQSVDLRLYDTDKSLQQVVALSEDASTGIWSVSMDRQDVDRAFFRYELDVFRFDTQALHSVESTDPYSVSLSTDSEYSQVVDLTDSDLKPSGWDSYTRPVIEDPTDLIIYEAHVRDFSARDQSTLQASPHGEDYRGKYRAFTLENTDPMNHLSGLADAGLNMLHLLPVNDLGSINEDPATRVDVHDTVGDLCALNTSADICNDSRFTASDVLLDVFASFDPATREANDLWEDMRFIDGYNWGYDPFHFFAPEGSYATDPEGVTAIIELRELIQTMHELGLTVALDVVYNHTFRAGLEDKSVLDRVVPGYYHRLDPISGEIEDSTCCPNTATEWRMMEKLMIDSLVLWAEHYRFDAFRFDLMGHIPLAAGLRAREAVQAVHPTNYFYGEGWNFGEVANNQRFFQASQLNKAGTGIGTFSDRLREAVRQGALFADYDNHPTNVVRYGLAGNLQDYELPVGGDLIRGADYLWNGQITGYSLEPFETVTYVSKHDNPTLWDMFHETLPDLTMSERVAAQQVALSYPLLAQGLPFIHMGSELLRSKSMDRDSYDSGDWFNYVDFTGQTNNWNVGLPSCEKNSAKCGSDHDRWDMIRDRIAANPSGPAAQDIQASSDWMQALLGIRDSSKLFRLPTTADISERVRFHNTGSNPLDGLIVMSIDDGYPLEEMDPNHDAVVALFNASHQSYDFWIEAAADKPFVLHPAITSGMAASTASFDPVGTFTVPARSTAVFVIERGAEQGEGLYGSVASDSGASVAFTCENGDMTSPGEHVFVVGDQPELGSWDPEQGVQMDAEGTWPTWEQPVDDLPADTTIEWKCVADTDPATWQGGSNNVVTTGSAGSTVSSTGSF